MHWTKPQGSRTDAKITWTKSWINSSSMDERESIFINVVYTFFAFYLSL